MRGSRFVVWDPRDLGPSENESQHPARLVRSSSVASGWNFRDPSRRSSAGMNNSDPRYMRNAAFAVGALFQSKWRVQILCAMRFAPVRLGELARIIPGASKKMLTQNLRQLEAEGIVVRKNMSDLVLHIEYELDDSMKEGVCILLDQLAEWGAIVLGELKDG